VTTRNLPEAAGFRSGSKGTHTSRTIMLDELTTLLAAVPDASPRAAYIGAIAEDNVLAKSTVSTRKLSAQRLSELYILDPNAPLFRVLRRLWEVDASGRPLLALLCALARDPLLRATAAPVLALRPGEELSRQAITDALRRHSGDRFNDSTLDKVVRNTSASWVQSGHLQGRVRKIRRLVRPTPATTAYALVLGFLEGLRGARLFTTQWTRVLDAEEAELRYLAAEAKRIGLIDLKTAADVIEIAFSPILTAQEIKDSRVAN
jgi:hypothetical protein